MSEPIQRGEQWWQEADNGTWYRWNTEQKKWEPQSTAPPPADAPAEPSAPEPAQPSTGAPVQARPQTTAVDVLPSVPAGGGLASLPRPKVLIAAAAALALVANLVVTRPWSAEATDQPAGATEQTQPEINIGPVARRGERTIYDGLGSSDRCVSDETKAWAGGMRTVRTDKPGIEDDLKRVSANIEDIRGHSFTTRVKTKLVPREEVGTVAAEEAVRHYSKKQAEIDSKILAALGVVQPGTDLRALSRGVTTTSVAGYYLPGKNKLVAGTNDGALAAYDEVVLAHELDHALVDQAIGLPELGGDPVDGDRLLAARTVVEGDATLAMSHYAFVSLTADQLLALLAHPETTSAAQPSESTPWMISRSMTFPYVEGMLFACEMFSHGGWPAVDEALRHPPTATVQILFPNRYLRGYESVDPADPVTPPARWKKVESASFGAAELLWLFQSAGGRTPAGPGDRVEWVKAFNGGDLHAYKRGKDFAMAATFADRGLRVSRKITRSSLCDSLGRWHNEAFPGAQPLKWKEKGADAWRRGNEIAVLSCRPGTARFVVAPDVETAKVLAGSLS